MLVLVFLTNLMPKTQLSSIKQTHMFFLLRKSLKKLAAETKIKGT